MNLAAFSGLAKPKPPPLWLVTNGETTVGPVTTTLLVHGVIADMIPKECLVRQSAWTRWRNVETLREVRALRRAQERFGRIALVPESVRPFDPFAAFRKQVEGLTDTSAILTDMLLEVVRRTGAAVGAVHRRRPPYVGYVTSSILGPGMLPRLGNVLPKDDEALHLARTGVVFSEVPRPASVSGRVCERLGTFPAFAGILVIGVRRRNGLEAMVELGRADHPFRTADEECATDAARIAAARLDALWSLRLS